MASRLPIGARETPCRGATGPGGCVGGGQGTTTGGTVRTGPETSAIHRPRAAAPIPGEAYVDTSPAVDCVPTSVEAGQQVRARYDLDHPPGAEGVRVVGPEGSEIVVPLVRQN